MRRLGQSLGVAVVVSASLISRGEVLRVPTPEFANIQRALDLAADGDTVLVAPGEYEVVEPIDFNRRHDPDDPASPPVKDVIVRSEAGPRTTIIRMSPTPFDPTRASVFVFDKGETADTVLEGFTIGQGLGTLHGGCPASSGGGIFCDGTSAPTIRDCVITGNVAFRGSGIFCAASSSPTIIGCRIERNGFGFLSRRDGRGAIVCDTVPLGGGLSCVENASVVLRECTVSANRAPEGGGLCLSGRTPSILERCVIAGNYADWEGGGIAVFAGITLTNCAIVGNATGGRGGGIVFAGFSGAGQEAVNCTIAGNSASSAGGGVSWRGGESPPVIRNTIVWGNLGGAIDGEPAVTFSCIEGTQVRPGEGNINADPAFLFPGTFDFDRFRAVPRLLPDFIVEPPDLRLAPGSPAIDAGTRDGAPADDLDGAARPCGSGIDIGAFEHCPEEHEFRRGDANGRRGLDISDGIFILGHLFLGGESPSCLDAADTNDSGKVELSDAVAVFDFLFRGGASPPAPGPFACGPDPSEDALGCESPPECDG